MACCGSSATTGAVASTRSRQGPPPKLISTKSSKSLYGSQPFGDARSCEIFVEHAVAGFWHCASCGVPKCSHFNAKRCAAVPPPKDHAGPVYQRKGSKRGGSWRDREATLVAGKLKLFEVAEGGGPGPHVATYVVDANAHVVVGDRSEGRRHALRIETASGARVRLACAAPEARDAWVAALVATQAWLVKARARVGNDTRLRRETRRAARAIARDPTSPARSRRSAPGGARRRTASSTAPTRPRAASGGAARSSGTSGRRSTGGSGR